MESHINMAAFKCVVHEPMWVVLHIPIPDVKGTREKKRAKAFIVESLLPSQYVE